MFKLFACHDSGFECLGKCFGVLDFERIIRKLIEYGYEMVDAPYLEDDRHVIVPVKKA